MRMVRNISIPPAETLSLHLESCVVHPGLEVGHVLVSDELGDLLPLDSLVDAPCTCWMPRDSPAWFMSLSTVV